MPRHMSNRNRIEKLQAEAEATTKEKEEAKKKKASPTRRKATPKKEAAPARMKIVWTVTDPKLKIVGRFPYPLKAAAEAEAARLTTSSGNEHKVRPEKVPMDD